MRGKARTPGAPRSRDHGSGSCISQRAVLPAWRLASEPLARTVGRARARNHDADQPQCANASVRPRSGAFQRDQNGQILRVFAHRSDGAPSSRRMAFQRSANCVPASSARSSQSELPRRTEPLRLSWSIGMFRTVESARCRVSRGLPSDTCKPHPGSTETSHALTINPDQSNGATHHFIGSSTQNIVRTPGSET